ncbi:rho GTPase-activating protein 28 isoform X4 [Dermochelys coriacea]|uniref:rho GTPase-activating protein 28 isoform X4 n=1 Tax=Dermochelys coriacea TaxID=27794 RepID=UPI001CA83383|nr:rho GTPase-activating protein 28 isoform X4 [Dermochelys coriacea]
MEIKDSGSVVLTAYHSYTPSRIPIIEQSFVPEISSSHSPISRKSLPRCRRINRMLSNESLHPPMFSRSNSQASVDSTSMEDFWCEVESIKENSEQGQEEQTLLEVKPADEGELEAEWLQDVGLSTLISGAEEEDGQALLSTLTRTQAAAVQRRYNTYTQTMRKKNKHSVRDVRDIFGVNDSSPTFETVPVSPVPSNGIQLPGQKPVWKSVSSNSCLDCGLDKDSPSVTEELSYEVSFSESITVVPKNRERQNNLRFKKDDSALPNLRQEIEIKFHEDTFDWDQVRNNDAAGLLKMFIRELPSPLFTVEYLPAFITLVEKVSKVKLQLQALHLLIMLLPDANRDTAKAFLQFLKKIVANEGKNKMNLWNVSMIVAPNVFIYKGKHANQEEMQAAATTAHIVRLLIKYQDILWTVPYFLISQVRKMNEATMNNTKRQMMFDKGVRRLLRRKTMERERPERSETHIPEGVIRVYAPLHSKVSMAIQLNGQTKARDILARFHCANSHASSKNTKVQIQRLYEIGGNIGLHCLDPDAYMLDVYRANPQAEWVIKPKSS